MNLLIFIVVIDDWFGVGKVSFWIGFEVEVYFFYVDIDLLYVIVILYEVEFCYCILMDEC